MGRVLGIVASMNDTSLSLDARLRRLRERRGAACMTS
jgi:hypothetical protein